MNNRKSELSTQNSWIHTQGPDYLNMIRHRIENVDLVWVSQFLDILQGESDKSVSVKDIGCQAFQFYKEIKKRGVPFDYHGYELDQNCVDLGLEYFPELSKKVLVGDFAKLDEVKHTDVTVCSATIEHIDSWIGFLQRMLNTTSNVVVIRSFFGENTKRDICNHNGATDNYPIWQFSFSEFLAVIRKCGFFSEIVRDRYTDSFPKYLDVLPDGIIRTQYVVVARRIGVKAQVSSLPI